MKRICLIVFCIALSNLKAQTLTLAFNEPSPGNVDQNYKLDTSAYTSGLPLSTTGSNVAWNFTQVEAMFPVLIDSVIQPSAATGNSLFPGASFSQNRSSLYTFFKSSSSPAQTELMGAWSPSLVITFTNTAIIASYPVSYGYSLTDPVSGTFKYGSNSGAANGDITISADGLGTLNFPSTSFQNVLRLKSVEQVTFTIGIFPVGTINQTVYKFYVPGKKFPVLSVDYTKYALLAGTPTITATAYGAFDYFSVAGLNEVFSNKSSPVYPNPFHENINVRSGNPEEKNEYSVFDTNGRLLQSVAKIEDLEEEKLSPGIYVFQIKNKSGTTSQKIVKE
jgi:hypothetical protein